MRNVKKFFILVPFWFSLVSYSVYSTETLNQDSQAIVQLNSIQELRSIEISLAWRETYSVFDDLLNILFPKAYAIVSPDYQLHYLHTLKFDHRKQVVIDTYQSFTGIDSGKKIIFKKVRDTKHYQTFQHYLEGQPSLCQNPPIKMGWVGPIQPSILFINMDGTQYYADFPDNPSSIKHNYQLCSQAFADYLRSLQSTR